MGRRREGCGGGRVGSPRGWGRGRGGVRGDRRHRSQPAPAGRSGSPGRRTRAREVGEERKCPHLQQCPARQIRHALPSACVFFFFLVRSSGGAAARPAVRNCSEEKL
jgi:hypothetical protein